MQNQIVQKSESFVRQLFKEKLSEKYVFHNLEHTLSVYKFSKELGEQQQVTEEELEILAIAAWFHDAGYTEIYAGHEGASCRIARDFLETQKYPEAKINSIIHCIEATHTRYVPQSPLQKILKDADLSNLGLDSFFELNEKLRQEWDVICSQQYTDIEWFENNLQFLADHKFFTKEARAKWKEGKKANFKKMKHSQNRQKKKC